MDEFGARIALNSSDRDAEALRWTAESLKEDEELELFVQGIPGFFASAKESPALPNLLDDGLGFRIKDLLMGSLANNVRQTRAVACLDAIRVLTIALRGMPFRATRTNWTSYFDLFGTGDEIGRMLSTCRNDNSPTIGIHAICVIAVVAGTFLEDSLLLSRQKNPTLLELLSSFGALDMCGLSTDAARYFEKGHLAVLINFIHALVLCPSIHEEGLAVTMSTLDFIVQHSSVRVDNACAELQDAFIQSLIAAVGTSTFLPSNSSSRDQVPQAMQTALPYPVIGRLMIIAAGLRQPNAKVMAKLVIGDYLGKHPDDQLAKSTLTSLETVPEHVKVSIASAEASATHPPAVRLQL